MARWDKPVRPAADELPIGPLRPTTGAGLTSHPLPYTGTLPESPLYGTSPGPWEAGVTGESNTGPGVHGVTSVNDAAPTASSDGVFGESRGGRGVHGVDYGNGIGILGESGSAVIVPMKSWEPGSPDSHGVLGISHSPTGAGVSGSNDAGGQAGFFDGGVTITGILNIGSSGDVILNDCAEHFSVMGEADPGTVMVIDGDDILRPSTDPYDKKVAGVVSGAGNYRPGIILGKPQTRDNELLVALFGKVYCKVDARYSPIEVGDLLTTSPTPGHAMKAQDQSRALGSVIGKALRPLDKGQALIPILVALQ